MLGVRKAASGAKCKRIPLLLLLLGWCALVQGAESGSPAWRIVVLRGTGIYSAAATIYDQAMRDVVSANAGRAVEFYPEALDFLRFSGQEFKNELVPFLRKKYADRSIALVVASSPAALDFMVRYRDAIWPGVPVVFYNVVEESVRGRRFPLGFTGLTIDLDPAGMLDVALRLQPDARLVAIVAGTAPYDENWVRRIKPALERKQGRVEVRWLRGPLEETLAAVAKLPAGAVVLYLSMISDGTGRLYVQPEVAKRIAETSSVPVYGLLETYMGTGIVGGAIASFRAQGEDAGKLALRVLNGETPDGIGIQRSTPARCTVDSRQLQRWGLKERRLGPDCVILYREPSLWDTYRWHIVAVGAVIFVQTLLIVALIVQRRRRQVAELEVQRQRTELAHTSRLATLGELSAAIAHEVNQPLGAISGNAEAVELLLDADPPKLEDARRVLLDLKKANQRASDVVRRIRGLLRKKELEFEPYDLNGAASDVVRLLDADAVRQEVEILTEFGPLPVVRGDRLHFQQVLLNLIVNGMDAMASMPAGQRYLTVRTARNEDGDAEITVVDTGPGIQPADMPRLFDSFFTTKKDGMGLGLALCRTVVRAHGGHIAAQNNPGGGATFRFTLPIDGQVQ